MLSSIQNLAILAALMTAGLSVAQANTPNAEITFINIPRLHPDGTASATIEKNGCPVALGTVVSVNPPEYTFTAYSRPCTYYDGSIAPNGQNVPELECKDGSGKFDNIRRTYENVNPSSIPCPPQCNDACSQIDPDWGSETAKTMFAFNWYQPNVSSASKRSALNLRRDCA